MNLASVPEATSAASALAAFNEGEVTLRPRGIVVALRCDRIQDAMDAGIIPKPVTRRVIDAMTEGEELDAETVAKIGEETKQENPDWEMQLRAYVGSCIVSVFGEPGPLRAEDTYQFSDAEFAELMAYCMREKPLPGKAPTPTAPPDS